MLIGRRTWRTKLASRTLATGLVLAGSGGAVAASLVETACSKDNPSPSSPAPVVIGVSMGLTNDLATFAAPLRDAVRAAESEVNANGGVLGRPIRFDVVDDKSDEGAIVQGVVRGFANANVAAVIGPIGSGQVKASAQILADKQIISISPSATSVELTTLEPADQNRFLFRTTPADDFQGAAVILFAAKTPRGIDPDGGVVVSAVDAGDGGAGNGSAVTTCKKMALVYIDNSYGVSMADAIKANFPKVGAGYSVVSDEKLPLAAASSYADVVKRVYATDPECLAIIAYTTAGVQFVRDFQATDTTKFASLASNGFFFIGTDGVFTQGFIDTALNDPSNPSKGAATNGVFGTNPDTQPGTVEYNAFRTVYSSYFPLAAGADAPAFASNAYDAAVLAALAVEKAGSADNRAAIRQALIDVSAPPGKPVGPQDVGVALTSIRGGLDVDYKGASGSVDFQANGNVTGGFIVWEVVQDPVAKTFGYRTVARFSQDDLSVQIK